MQRMRQNHKLFYYLVSLIVISNVLMGCSDSIDEISEDQLGDDSKVSVVIKRSFLNTQDNIDFKYFSMSRTNDNGIIRFDYVVDSIFSAKDSVLRNRENKELFEHTLSFLLKESNDTLYIFDIGVTTNEYDSETKCLVADSINIEFEESFQMIYHYRSLSEDPMWDEDVYFSRELGFLFSDFKALNTEDEVIHHSLTSSNELKIITNEIKANNNDFR